MTNPSHVDRRRGGAAVAFELVVIAASAGGLAALGRLLGGLPAGFPLPLAVVQHLDPRRESQLAEILGRRTGLRVKEAEAEEGLTAGVVYIAPPGSHMEIGPGHRIHLADTPPVHFARPSADRLFISAAHACSPIIAVILTGTGSDGAAGAAVIKAAGGAVIAQDRATSEFFGMPHAAIESGVVDFVLPVDEIASALIELVGSHG